MALATAVSLRAPAVTELWILNAFADNNGHVTVFGTSGRDTFQFGDSQGSKIVRLNGVTYEPASTQFQSLTYHGSGGGERLLRQGAEP